MNDSTWTIRSRQRGGAGGSGRAHSQIATTAMIAVPVAAIHSRGAVRNMITAQADIIVDRQPLGAATDRAMRLPVADHRTELAVRQQPVVQPLRAARGGEGRQQHERHRRQAGTTMPTRPRPRLA